MLLLATLPDDIICKINLYVIFIPKNKDELQNAVDLWCYDMKSAYKIYGHISLWNTKYITCMSHLFRYKTHFNSVISSWNVSRVTDMSFMFFKACKFNQPLNNWDVSNVTSMVAMFCEAFAFNQPLNNWDVSNVELMEMLYTFHETISLSQRPNWYNK